MSPSNALNYAFSLIPSPFSLVPNLISNKIIVALFNQVFKQAIEAGDLDFLKGNWVSIKVTDIDLEFAFSLKGGSLIDDSQRHSHDLSIRAKACDFLSMITKQKDPDTLFFQRKIQMQGSTELGLYVKNFLDAFEVESHWFSHKTDRALQKGYPLLKKIFCKDG
jgi:O2-independent ubiquinone biosynthesis accessory factor UbiT